MLTDFENYLLYLQRDMSEQDRVVIANWLDTGDIDSLLVASQLSDDLNSFTQILVIYFRKKFQLQSA